MRLHRFLVENIEFDKHDSRNIIIREKNLLNQLLNVFRFKEGSRFVIFDGTGVEFFVELSGPLHKSDKKNKEISVEIKEEKSGLKRNKKMSLVFAMTKKENMELVLQKCTELGVTSFVPIITERTVKTGWNFERMEKIVREAIEQSGFSDLPVVSIEPERLEKFLEKTKKERGNLDGLCALDFDGVPLSSLKHLISVDTVFVGPEGGWSDKERKLFQKFNIKKISLGQNVLRAETACIAVSSIFLL
jgi:16S rRNA (uracil1498-N3)-methyltransferase